VTNTIVSSAGTSRTRLLPGCQYSTEPSDAFTKNLYSIDSLQVLKVFCAAFSGPLCRSVRVEEGRGESEVQFAPFLRVNANERIHVLVPLQQRFREFADGCVGSPCQERVVLVCMVIVAVINSTLQPCMESAQGYRCKIYCERHTLQVCSPTGGSILLPFTRL
jgi:hypothetical protein